MTNAQFTRRARKWKSHPALDALGVSMWEIEVIIVHHIDDEPAEAQAKMVMARSYDTGELVVRQDFIKDADERDADLLILHELCHVAVRNVDTFTHNVLDLLGREASTLAHEEYGHVREQLVDRMARSIYAAASE